MSHSSSSHNRPESFNDEHEAFAASRVSQYVFVPTKDTYFNAFDQHADTLEGDVKPPLVLSGHEGSGKSALLANWVAKRREHKHRDEFLFQHFVGCTTQSLELAHTLFRLETALKDFFQLREMKVPDTEVELRWSLNRFLEAASKKHSPARIVIIIDGVHRLKADNTPDGTLYWLPTELPPCVRFIVSTVEFERSKTSKTNKDNVQHHTFVELTRRNCTPLKIEPLGVTTRHSVINAFCNLFDFEISESQQFKIVTAHSSAQPMYLRTLLQALRLATTLTRIPPDELLEKFLLCTTAHELTDKNLNICCQSPEDETVGMHLNEYGDNMIADLLGKMLTVIYVSRSGLTETEIWGLLALVSRFDTNEEQNQRLMSIIKDYTMVVDNMYSFSHEIYREVVYAKYIKSRAQLVKWHHILAQFFGQLPPCDRKLVALPYHLEMAGSWTKVKNCLTDIEMFQIWWTLKFKSDFIKFWSSLTRKTFHDGSNEETDEGGNLNSSTKANLNNNSSPPLGADGGGDPQNNVNLWKNRPSYDVVDEYVKALDEYRNLKKPTDEQIAAIILEIGDFLLEFATLGHENNADVPSMIHPKILQEDLKSIGVPYIEIDEEGRSSLVYPEILHQLCNKQKTDDGIMMDAPTKAIEDVPVCTNYYYHRWMWIQFPYIALGNCDARYHEGVEKKLQDMSDTQGKYRSLASNNNLTGMPSNHNLLNTTGSTTSIGQVPATLNRSATALDGINKKLKKYTANLTADRKDLSSSWNSSAFKLPEIKFNRKAAKSIPRVSHDDGNGEEEGSSKVLQRIFALQDSIQNYREEYDFLIQQKSILSRRLQDFKDNLVDLQRTAASCFEYDDELDNAIKREADSAGKYEKVKVYHKNLQQLALMCDRHPANVPALITELQNKIDLDAFLLTEIKKRLWEQKFERQTAMNTFATMKKLVSDALEMHGKLNEYRVSMINDLKIQAKEDEKLLEIREQLRLKKTKRLMESSHSLTSLQANNANNKNSQHDQQQLQQQMKKRTWEENWALISSRTGVLEPEAFFQRLNNASALEQQINTIKKTSESRLENLKKEVVAVESELEEVRYEASFAGVQSTKEHKKQLADKQMKFKQAKEKTEGMEQLQQKVIAGLAHVCDILFIPKSEEDDPVVHLVRDIEAVLDTLINEREKQLQQQQGGAGNANGGGPSGLSLGGGLTSAGGVRDSLSSMLPETHSNTRSPELDYVIAKHESPKVRLPNRLPSKPPKEKEERDKSETTEEDDQDDEPGTWDRHYVKTISLKAIRSDAKRRQKDNTANGQTITPGGAGTAADAATNGKKKEVKQLTATV